MKTILAIIGLGAILYGAFLYRHSFDTRPLTDKLSTPILNPEHPDIQEGARVINHVEDAANEKIAEAKRLANDPVGTAKRAANPEPEKSTN